MGWGRGGLEGFFICCIASFSISFFVFVFFEARTWNTFTVMELKTEWLGQGKVLVLFFYY